MPEANRFRHQAYTSAPPRSPYSVLRPGPPPPVESDEFRRRMQEVGASFRQAGVAAVYLVHGTHVGPDPLGIIAELARVAPSLAAGLRRVTKRTIDRVAGEAGNYTAGYARCFASSINAEHLPRIPVRLFQWSSQNHHLGRAEAAVRLIDELAAREEPREKRVLLWGHSHAGNMFALMTNLLAGDRETLDRFFEAAEIHYRRPISGRVDLPVWDRVRQRLGPTGPPPLDLPLDMVTFGTPVRYGWDTAGYAQLVHFVHHRPVEGLPDYLAPFPPKVGDLIKAARGDYVQQLAIAGTNTAPTVFAWRTFRAERRLSRMLEVGLAPTGRLERFRAGKIVPDEGTTLLVDYGQPESDVSQHHAGHAVYTRKAWLLFHAEQVARRFYSADVEDPA